MTTKMKELTERVENPYADRRFGDDWRRADVFPQGYYLCDDLKDLYHIPPSLIVKLKHGLLNLSRLPASRELAPPHYQHAYEALAPALRDADLIQQPHLALVAAVATWSRLHDARGDNTTPGALVSWLINRGADTWLVNEDSYTLARALADFINENMNPT